MRGGDEIVARARGCVGARFRPHGRDPAYGLDCVGVAVRAFGREAAGGYPLRSADRTALDRLLVVAGLRPIAIGEAGAGDLVVIAAAPTQLHLAVLTGDGFVHADLGLRRVVEVPGRPVGVIGAWREDIWRR